MPFVAQQQEAPAAKRQRTQYSQQNTSHPSQPLSTGAQGANPLQLVGQHAHALSSAFSVFHGALESGALADVHALRQTCHQALLVFARSLRLDLINDMSDRWQGAMVSLRQARPWLTEDDCSLLSGASPRVLAVANAFQLAVDAIDEGLDVADPPPLAHGLGQIDPRGTTAASHSTTTSTSLNAVTTTTSTTTSMTTQTELRPQTPTAEDTWFPFPVAHEPLPDLGPSVPSSTSTESNATTTSTASATGPAVDLTSTSRQPGTQKDLANLVAVTIDQCGKPAFADYATRFVAEFRLQLMATPTDAEEEVTTLIRSLCKLGRSLKKDYPEALIGVRKQLVDTSDEAYLNRLLLELRARPSVVANGSMTLGNMIRDRLSELNPGD